jgi:gliding motility-associated lipoprotein GldH
MIKGKFNHSLILIISSFCLLLSCNNNVVYTESTAMPANKWELLNIPSFSVPVSDTIHSNNVIFTIRTGSSYPFRNIYLFVRTISPAGVSITDTLQYFLADEKGKWFGKGFGDIHELDLPYKSNVYFPVRGTYRFTVQHGMRVEDLDGVYDFGLRIVKTGK